MAKRKQDENLIPNSQRSPSELREQTRRGGIASGEARRRKADLRRAAQELLDATFTDKKGNKLTGQEIMMKGLIANLSDPKGRNWSKAMDIAIQLTGNSMLVEQLAKLKAETELIKAKTKAIETSRDEKTDIEDLAPLAELLRDDDEQDCND